ncbi:MAG: hypothetical protein ACE5JA_05240 [bacterium]
MVKTKLTPILAAATALLSLLSFCAAVSRPEEALREEGLPLNVVWQKEFEEPISYFIAEDASPAGVDLRVLVTPSRLFFFDTTGEVAKAIILDNEVFLSFSGNSRYVGVRRLVEHGEPSRSKLDVYDLSGNRMWTREGLRGDNFIISPDGRFSFSTSIWTCGKFAFLSEAESKVIDTSTYISVGASYFDFAEKTLECVVSFGEEEIGSWLALLGPSGDLKWKKRISEPPAPPRDVVFANSGLYIATTSSHQGRFTPLFLHLFNRGGDLIWRKEVQWQASGKPLFSKDERYVLTTSPTGRAYVFETKSGKKSFELHLVSDTGKENISITGARISGHGRFFLLTTKDKSTGHYDLKLFSVGLRRRQRLLARLEFHRRLNL